MKLNNSYIALLTLCLALSGCRQDVITDIDNDSSSVKISPYIISGDRGSRIVEQNGNYSFSKGDSLALVIFQEGGSPYKYEERYIQTVSYDGAAWNACYASDFKDGVDDWMEINGVKWPEYGDSYEIFAYRPDVKQPINWPVYSGSVNQNQDIQENFYYSDFMYGKVVTPKTNNPVSIPMKHQLSMLTVELLNTDDLGGASDGMIVSAYPEYWAHFVLDEVHFINYEIKDIKAYRKGDNVFSVILPAQELSGEQVVIVLSDGSKRQLDFTLQMERGVNHVLKVDCRDSEKLEVIVSEKIPWDETVDVNSGEYVESKIYNTGDVIVYQKKRVENPVTLVVTGDGYTLEDLLEGGTFERHAREALDFLFEVEPYKTYRDYFNVYIIPALSREKGADNYTTRQDKDTYFNSGWEDDYSSMGANETTVTNFLKDYCPDIVEGHARVEDVPICLLINDKRYGGVCYSWASGKSYAIVPITEGIWRMGNDEELGISVCDWRNTFLHEFGGHSFGRLLDEYYDEGGGRTYSGKTISQHYWQVPMGLNVTADTTGVDGIVYWKDKIGNQRFPKVGFYEGGYTYEKGIWRSEAISAMDDNRRYFNAISRQIIVERIKKKANEPFDIDDFYSKDVDYDELRDSKSRVTFNIENLKEYPRTPGPVLIE